MGGRKEMSRLHQCASEDRVSSCKVKGLRFDSRSGHVPGLWVRSLVGVCKRPPIKEETSLPLFIPLSKNK